MAKESKPRLTTPVGIACFAHVFEPHAIEAGKDKKYSIVLVFDKATVPQLKELKLACVAAAESKFGPNAREMIKKGKLRMPWRPGSDYEEYGAPFDEEGSVFISIQSNTAPGVVDRRAKPLMSQDQFYSGCKARATYAAWPYDSNGNKGVTLLLNNVQKAADGDRLSGKPSAEDDFDEVEGADDDLADDDI